MSAGRTPGVVCTKVGLPPELRGYVVRWHGAIIGRVFRNSAGWWSYTTSMTDNQLPTGSQPRREDAVELLVYHVTRARAAATKVQAASVSAADEVAKLRAEKAELVVALAGVYHHLQTGFLQMPDDMHPTNRLAVRCDVEAAHAVLDKFGVIADNGQVQVIA